MIRIKYKMNESGVLVSKPMLVGQDHLVVNLIPSENRLTIVSLSTGEVLLEDTANTSAKLKKLAKRHMQTTFGMTFHTETRNRSKSVSSTQEVTSNLLT